MQSWSGPLPCIRLLCKCSTSSRQLRHISLCSRVESQTYKVDVTATKSGSPFSCSFLAAPNLLLILLPREVCFRRAWPYLGSHSFSLLAGKVGQSKTPCMQIVIFDLEYGQPAASSPLVSVRTPFRDVLGCFGHGISGRDSSRPGLDSLFCSHEVYAIRVIPSSNHF